MKESEAAIVRIVQANPQVFNEIECRDVVFRRDFDGAKRREVAPWGMLGRERLRQEEDALWFRLDAGEVSSSEAIEMMTDLMEQYYGKKYSLR